MTKNNSSRPNQYHSRYQNSISLPLCLFFLSFSLDRLSIFNSKRKTNQQIRVRQQWKIFPRFPLLSAFVLSILKYVYRETCLLRIYLFLSSAAAAPFSSLPCTFYLFVIVLVPLLSTCIIHIVHLSLVYFVSCPEINTEEMRKYTYTTPEPALE